MPDSIFDRSRMSLIRLSRSVPAPWMVRANSTCFGCQVVVGVFAELLSQHQDAVERRAQLVRHVGQEFGFVLRSEGQFFRLLFQSAASLLDFLVLAFHFDVLFGELLRLLRELLVGLLQFFLLRLQFGRQLLRLLQQAFGLHRGFNTVEHDADAGRQLLQERKMRSGKGAQRSQFDDRFDAIFEEHRQNDDVARNCLEQAGTNRNRLVAAVPRSTCAVFQRRTCPTKPSPILRRAQMAVFAIVGKCGQQHHAG